MILEESLRCPCDFKVPLKTDSDCLACTRDECGRNFPILDGIPVLIDDSNSVVSISDFAPSSNIRNEEKNTQDITDGRYGSIQALERRSFLRLSYQRFGRYLMDFSVKLDIFSEEDAVKFLQNESESIKILVLGSSDQSIEARASDTVVYTDLAMGQHVNYISDAHDIPFDKDTFDLVIISSILDDVTDPYRCVAEIYRVLNKDGYVYAVTPFMQPVHSGVYDFTRFTMIGYRRLFRNFSETRLGMALGPGSALAYGIQYYLLSFTDYRPVRTVLRLIGLIITLPLKFTDKFLRKQKSALDYAAGYYFFGKKSAQILSDHDLIQEFKERRRVT